ncbi:MULTISPECIES: 4-hydroxy-tetrahydrodipicolinate reductase [unclassified Chryseobacterium]|uniref:4-hydroxy-tetrahydrodipicolinate reductase n=1 Tax=unclassified Chryseobacterium TaxID=2593645 RepID=UPI00226A1DEF|nr:MULTISPECIES: 4-hydroxy-tetrahydrodipicolinate reductase [unclassified Chryseobacterium]
MKKVLVAGATGWAGSEISKAILENSEMTLTGGLSRAHNGNNLAEVLPLENDQTVPLFDTIENAMEHVDFDILVEFTKPQIAKHNIISALKKGKKVIVGTSGLSDEDYEEIEKIALENNTSALAAGNFAITMVLLQKFAEMAAQYIPNYEIIDYADESKIDAPSGTVAELAYRLSKVQQPNIAVPIEETIGNKATRGATINGIQVHSVRLPGHIISVETIFGLKGEKLTLRHDSTESAEPYVKGVLLAIQNIETFKGLKRGLDTIMQF